MYPSLTPYVVNGQMCLYFMTVWMVTSKWIDLWLVCLSYVVIFFYEREIEHCNPVILSNYLICWLFTGSPRFTLVQEHISRLPRSSVSWRKPPTGKSSKLCWGKGHNCYRLYLYCFQCFELSFLKWNIFQCALFSRKPFVPIMYMWNFCTLFEGLSSQYFYV